MHSADAAVPTFASEAVRTEVEPGLARTFDSAVARDVGAQLSAWVPRGARAWNVKSANRLGVTVTVCWETTQYHPVIKYAQNISQGTQVHVCKIFHHTLYGEKF